MKNLNDFSAGLIDSEYILSPAQLQQMLKMIHSIRGINSAGMLIKRMAVTLQELLPCAKSMVWIYDPLKESLWTVIDNAKVKSGLEDSLAGRVFLTRKAVHFTDPAKDDYYNAEIDAIAGAQNGHVLCEPVFDQENNIIAIIQVMNTIIHPITSSVLNFMQEWALVSGGMIEGVLKNEEIKNAFDSFVDTLSRVMDTRDYITSGHSRRVTLYAIELAKQMGLNVREMEVLRYAGLLHDIGKIGIPELILLKDKRPSDDEFEIIKRHATLTRSILEKIRFPKKYNQIVEIASTHHERMNGRGYPLGLKGDDIPRGGKILAVCDVFDALTSRRPYEDRIAIKEVIHILDKETGESFEPFIVYHFKNITLDRIIQVMELGFSSGIEQDDLDFLKDYTLNDLVSMENIKSDDQQKLENTFLRYYSRQYRV